MENGFREPALVFQGEANNIGLVDCAAGRFAGRGDHEIRKSAPLDLCRALQNGVNIRRKTRFKPGENRTRAINQIYGNLPY